MTELMDTCVQLVGTVVPGDRRGRTLGFPTANLRLDHPLEQSISDGVYAAWCVVDEGLRWPAAVSVGRRSTFGAGGERLIEANLLGFDGDLYGRRLRISIARRVRGQRRFAGVDELVAQIRLDVSAVRRLLGLDTRTVAGLDEEATS